MSSIKNMEFEEYNLHEKFKRALAPLRAELRDIALWAIDKQLGGRGLPYASGGGFTKQLIEDELDVEIFYYSESYPPVIGLVTWGKLPEGGRYCTGIRLTLEEWRTLAKKDESIQIKGDLVEMFYGDHLTSNVRVVH